jgi:hypothetical protein
MTIQDITSTVSEKFIDLEKHSNLCSKEETSQKYLRSILKKYLSLKMDNMEDLNF